MTLFDKSTIVSM